MGRGHEGPFTSTEKPQQPRHATPQPQPRPGRSDDAAQRKEKQPEKKEEEEENRMFNVNFSADVTEQKLQTFLDDETDSEFNILLLKSLKVNKNTEEEAKFRS